MTLINCIKSERPCRAQYYHGSNLGTCIDVENWDIWRVYLCHIKEDRPNVSPREILCVIFVCTEYNLWAVHGNIALEEIRFLLFVHMAKQNTSLLFYHVWWQASAEIISVCSPCVLKRAQEKVLSRHTGTGWLCPWLGHLRRPRFVSWQCLVYTVHTTLPKTKLWAVIASPIHWRLYEQMCIHALNPNTKAHCGGYVCAVWTLLYFRKCNLENTKHHFMFLYIGWLFTIQITIIAHVILYFYSLF